MYTYIHVGVGLPYHFPSPSRKRNKYKWNNLDTANTIDRSWDNSLPTSHKVHVKTDVVLPLALGNPAVSLPGVHNLALNMLKYQTTRRCPKQNAPWTIFRMEGTIRIMKQTNTFLIYLRVLIFCMHYVCCCQWHRGWLLWCKNTCKVYDTRKEPACRVLTPNHAGFG